MNYIHNPYIYGPPYTNSYPAQPQPIGYGLPISPDYISPSDPYFPYAQPIEGQPMYHAVPVEDAENLSRPRLTKEQVGILEAQFQAHPKPNSKTKRQLAMQTSLTLPRVANWFQNRRAKAKQQRRQEQYERKLAEEEQAEKEKAESGRSAPVETASGKDDKTKALGSNEIASSSSASQPAQTSHLADRSAQPAGPLPNLAHSKSCEFERADVSNRSLLDSHANNESSTNTSSAYCSSLSSSIPGHAEQPSSYHKWTNITPSTNKPDEATTRECHVDTDVGGNAMGSSGVPSSQSPHFDITNAPMITTTPTSGLPEGDPSTAATSTTKKKMDIAKRRKRPRPADIGTSNKDVQYLRGPASAQSPRIMNSLGAHAITKPLRQVKSSHTLGIDYHKRQNVGVRDISAHRSPYSLSSFAESPYLGSTLDYMGSVTPSTANSVAFSQTLDTPSSATFSPVSSHTVMNLDPFDSKSAAQQHTPTSIAQEFMPSYTWPTAGNNHGMSDTSLSTEDAFSHPSNSFIPPPSDDFKTLDCPMVPPSANPHWMNPTEPVMPSPATKMEDSGLDYFIAPLENYEFPSSQLLSNGMGTTGPDAFPRDTTNSSPTATSEAAQVVPPPMAVNPADPSSKHPWFDHSAPFLLPNDQQQQQSFGINHPSTF